MNSLTEAPADLRGQWKIDLFAFLATALAGLGIWLAVAAAAGSQEAWESDYFYNVGFPCLALVSGLAGFLRPKRPWLWGISTVILQPIALYWGSSFAAFGFTSLFFFIAYGAALAFCAIAGARLRQLRN